ncbi:MAPEG family protein [Neptunomonas phycophila]|uniref:MAPEG family protein n=1 Tax=Neptunomonas phycophila TaxID=1572645 RepID=UPI0009490443|nr:MAPEG family protein [Neptunomonas phycophila]
MSIIYPMFALVVVTFVVGLSMGAARLISVKKGQVNPKYYKLLTGYEAPENIIKLSNNFSNLLEVPILFYILGVLLVALDISNSVILILAWCFVALRIVHSVIHITYNHPKHRFYAFLTSSLIVLAMWVKLIILIS